VAKTDALASSRRPIQGIATAVICIVVEDFVGLDVNVLNLPIT
jgi:hypothetical protein